MQVVKIEIKNKNEKETILINVEAIATIDIHYENKFGYGWVVDFYMNNKMYNAYNDVIFNPIRVPIENEEEGKKLIEKIYNTKDIINLGTFEKNKK